MARHPAEDNSCGWVPGAPVPRDCQIPAKCSMMMRNVEGDSNKIGCCAWWKLRAIRVRSVAGFSSRGLRRLPALEHRDPWGKMPFWCHRWCQRETVSTSLWMSWLEARCGAPEVRAKEQVSSGHLLADCTGLGPAGQAQPYRPDEHKPREWETGLDSIRR
jgi:hypothetical protein